MKRWVWSWGMPAPVEVEVATPDAPETWHIVCEPTEVEAIDRVVGFVGDVINKQKEATDLFFSLCDRSPKFRREYEEKKKAEFAAWKAQNPEN